jgi:hypothetical protein
LRLGDLGFWVEHLTHARRQNVRSGTCRSLLAASLLVAIALAASACSAPAATTPRGDPGGVTLSQLTEIRSAVPAGTLIGRGIAMEPHFTGVCTSTTPDVQVGYTFRPKGTITVTESEVTLSLKKIGWTRVAGTSKNPW